MSEALLGLAACLGNRGNAHFSLREYDQALACFAEAETIYRGLGNRMGFAATLSGLGSMYNDLGEHDKALASCAEAEAINRELGNRSGVALNLGNRGNVHADLGNNDQALDSYTQAEAIYRELGAQSSVALNLSNRGGLLRELGRLDEAWQAQEEALEICRATTAPRLLAHCTLGKAQVLLAQGTDLPQALVLAQETFELRTNMGMQKTSEFFQTLATISQIHWRLAERGRPRPQRSHNHEEEADGDVRPPTDHFAKAQEYALEAKALGEELKLPRIVEHGPKKGEVHEEWQWIEEALAE